MRFYGMIHKIKENEGTVMDWNTFFLVAAALLPAIILSAYVFKKDRAEKEPIGFLIQLFILGAAACLPAAYAESLVIGVIEKLFGFIYDADSGTFLQHISLFLYKGVYYFVGIALIEEGLKWFVVKKVAFGSDDFNSLFDGVIYAVFVSLGFAAFENIFYVLEYGFRNALMRAFLSVPGHMFFAVIMGYYFSFWHIREKARELEETLEGEGLITIVKPISVQKKKVMSLLMPCLAHGMYNFCCSSDSLFYVVAFYIFVAFLYWHCFGKIRRMSRADGPSNAYAVALLRRKYPHLYEEGRI